MNGIAFDEAKTSQLNQLLAGGPFAGTNCKMMLGKTLTALSHTDVYATLAAAELSHTGYARQDVVNWTSAVLTTDKHARSQADTVTFGNTSGSPSDTVTWWAFVDHGNSKILQAGLYDSPFVIGDGEDYLTTPFYTAFHEIAAEP